MPRGSPPLGEDGRPDPARVELAGSMRDIAAMGEGNVEGADADVACDAQGHMSANSEAQDVEVLGEDDGGASTNTPAWTPSSDMDVSDCDAMEDGSPAANEHPHEQVATDEPERGRRTWRTPEVQYPSSPLAQADRPFKSESTGSGSSSDSESTVRQSDRDQNPGEMDAETESPRPRLSIPPLSPRPNPLSFLEPDSPDVTPESIRRSIEESTARWRAPTHKSPSAQSSASSGSSTHSDVFSQTDLETSRSSSPSQSISSPPQAPARPPPRSYGTPEMPRGPANHPHIPPRALQPRLGGPSVKHLPRAEKLPLSGYQLLASKLSSSHPLSPPVQPIYRRFETLSHRVLLHLQDELAELEEQLYRLDTADTQTRRLRSCFLPASRRAEVLAGGELQWHKTDILGKIGYKLEQYNRVLSSFVKTQGLASPSPSELEEYRSFLEMQKPIAELETRFLDASDDLVALRSPPPAPDCLSSGAPTPMPFPVESPLSATFPEKEPQYTTPPQPQLSIPSLAAAIAVSVLLPVLAFASVPGLPGRMTVIWLVAVGVLNPLLQAGGLRGVDGRDAVACAGIYGGAMSVVAVVFA